MSQLSLFSGPGEAVLVNDARGRMAYVPRFVSAELARAWFAELRETVPWTTQRRRMYDRDVDVPRLTAHFPLAPEERGVPDVIRLASSTVIARTGVPFNTVGLNFYRDGRDSVAPHGDHLDEIAPGCPIALQMTTRAYGSLLRISRTASSPPISGMTMSMSTRSGWRRAYISTATRPFSASPRTS